jgi:osmotically-inducible protein OsmY
MRDLRDDYRTHRDEDERDFDRRMDDPSGQWGQEGTRYGQPGYGYGQGSSSYQGGYGYQGGQGYQGYGQGSDFGQGHQRYGQGFGRGYGRGQDRGLGSGRHQGGWRGRDWRGQDWRGSESGGEWRGTDWRSGESPNMGQSDQSTGYSGLTNDWDEQRGRFAGRGPKGYRRSDERIREDVSDRLTDDAWLDASNIEVKAENGMVTLSGNVGSRDDKRRAEDIVMSISGVKDVINQIHVDQGFLEQVSDALTGGESRREKVTTTKR